MFLNLKERFNQVGEAFQHQTLVQYTFEMKVLESWGVY